MPPAVHASAIEHAAHSLRCNAHAPGPRQRAWREQAIAADMQRRESFAPVQLTVNWSRLLRVPGHGGRRARPRRLRHPLGLEPLRRLVLGPAVLAPQHRRRLRHPGRRLLRHCLRLRQAGGAALPPAPASAARAQRAVSRPTLERGLRLRACAAPRGRGACWRVAGGCVTRHGARGDALRVPRLCAPSSARRSVSARPSRCAERAPRPPRSNGRWRRLGRSRRSGGATTSPRRRRRSSLLRRARFCRPPTVQPPPPGALGAVPRRAPYLCCATGRAHSGPPPLGCVSHTQPSR